MCQDIKGRVILRLRHQQEVAALSAARHASRFARRLAADARRQTVPTARRSEKEGYLKGKAIRPQPGNGVRGVPIRWKGQPPPASSRGDTVAAHPPLPVVREASIQGRVRQGTRARGPP